MDSILDLLRTRHRFLLTSHVNPDGDALGSEAALAAWLRGEGKTADIVNVSPTPAVYDFLDPLAQIRTYTAGRDDALIAGADVILVLDTNQIGRLRDMEQAVVASRAVKVCIDHHLDPAPFADHYLVDQDATSTGEIVFRILTSLSPEALSPNAATALYCAIMTDTGSFRYPRVGAATHRMVARLIDAGADPVEIYSLVYERWSPGRIHLAGEMLAGLQLLAGGRLAYVSISRDMLQRTGTTEEDTDNFTTYPMSIQGVMAGILFLELPDGVKISFRSRGPIPIHELAQEFGGNGHRNAAGARIAGGTLDDTRPRVLAAAMKYVESQMESR
jgi:phosphoesterase RecJ-like protein